MNLKRRLIYCMRVRQRRNIKLKRTIKHQKRDFSDCLHQSWLAHRNAFIEEERRKQRVILAAELIIRTADPNDVDVIINELDLDYLNWRKNYG